MIRDRYLVRDFSQEFSSWTLNMYYVFYKLIRKPFPTRTDYERKDTRKKLTSQNRDFIIMLLNGGEL